MRGRSWLSEQPLSLHPRCLTGLRQISRLPMTVMVLPKGAALKIRRMQIANLTLRWQLTTWHLLVRLLLPAFAGAGHLHGAWPVTRQAALLPRLAIMAVNCHRLYGVMRPVRSCRILVFMTRQFPKRASVALPRRSHWLKRIFMMLGTVLTTTIAASMMQMRLHWLGGGAWRFWKHIWPGNGKG